METVATPMVEREEKLARDLKRNDWIALWHLAKVLYVDVYRLRGREEVLLVYRDPYFNRPEVDFLDADLRLSIANPDEIPEDPDGSGRDVDNGDAATPVPAGVDGHGEGAAAGRAVTAQNGAE
jgi:hypothetical protein